MNLNSLLNYIVKHPDARVSISLKQLATEVLQSTNKKAELLCDFSVVARWVLSSHDREQIRTGKLSPYCTLYGGDLKAYGECILKFVEALEQAGVRPVFFVGGPPGFESNRTKFDQYREDSLQMQQRCTNIEQVCAGNRYLQVAWSFSGAMSMQVRHVLRSAGVHMINCMQGDPPLTEMVQYSEMHRSQVIGVVSRSVELVLSVPGLLVILPDVVGRIVADVTVKALTDETCSAVSSESLARGLGLKENQLADMAALICGHCGGSLLAELGLDDKGDVEIVAQWLSNQELPIHELYPDHKELMFQVQNQFLIPTSKKKCIPEILSDSNKSTKTDAPSGNSDSSDKMESTIPKSLAEIVKVKVQGGTMMPQLLSMVEGRFWRDSAVELATLGQPCINDLTLTLRTSLYSLMGLEKVTEYGRTGKKAFDTIPVELKTHVTCGLSQLKALEERTRNERLSLLFDLVGNPQRYQDCTSLEERVSTVCKIGSEISDPISGAAVVVCASLLLLFQANTVLGSFSGLTYSELDALLVSCLTCVAEYPPYVHLCRPPVRAVTIAMYFSHIIEQVYILASYLGLLDKLPSPASLFCSMAYVPYHMAGCSDREPPSSHFNSSSLAAVRDRFACLSNLEPVVAFQAEIVNEWKDPNLSSFLEQFSSSLEAVAKYKTQLTEKEVTARSSTAEGGLSLSIEWARDLDLSSSVDSNSSSIVKCSELSSAQDYIATEEELFFAALLEDDVVGDVIDSNDDVVGDEIFDDDNIFSISDSEPQQLVKSEGDTESVSECVEKSGNQNQQESCESPNPESVTAVVKSATLDANTAISSQAPTSSAPVYGPRSNPAAPRRSNPSSPRPIPAPPRSGEGQNELPVMAHREKILQLIHGHRVVCIEGETGCGKSTKIPQFILEDSLSSNPASPCKILVTQPRRVAVIKLAERVAAERRERLGQTVGYCIGGERQRTSETSLTYCTVGYLLQALVHNPSTILRYTHIILDEIHERSTDADFALIIVRKLVAASENLKVIIMSATMEGHTIANYFEQAIGFTEVADPYFVGAKRYKVDQYFIDELDQLVDTKKSDWSTWQTAASSNLKQLVLQHAPENLQDALKRPPAVTNFAQNICTELIISQATLGEQILVFLPGISEIAAYYDLLSIMLELREIKDHFLVFVMHSQVPFEDQKEMFRPPPPNKAHIILATNIAESSITLPKLRMVINFGIYRQLEYDSRRHMTQLTKKWCSQASCAQRAGRVGRVFEGVAVHLFTKRFYWVIVPEFDPPEILHAPLAKLVLQAKQIGSKMGIPLPSEFLSQAVDPPSLEQMELALQELASFGAIVSRPGYPVSEEAEITLLGRFALTLPLDIEFSRLVLYGIFFGVPTDAIVIAAAASLSQDVFSMPTRMIIKEDSVFSESLKRSMRSRCYFDGGQYSDPIMACNLFREWVEYRNRCAMEEDLLPKRTFLNSFCNSRAVRWNRLLLLEHSVAEVASRVLSHVPREYYLYDDIRVLSDITRYRRGFNFTSDLEESGGRRERKLRLSSISLHFCDNTNTIKALLAASFSHNFLIGNRGVESSFVKERKESCRALTVMSNLGYDPSETVVLKSDNTATVQDVQHLVSTVLPHRYCEVQLVDRVWYVHLHPEFSSNPKTALMRTQMGGRSEPEESIVGAFMTDTSVVHQKLSLDMCYFWQYGERKPSWKVASAAFGKPRHPLMVSWTRVRKEKESVFFGEWRNPSGLICDLSLQCPPFLGVASTMQGIQYRNAVTARGVTILPSLANGKEALLMLLAFQSQAMKVDFLVSDDSITGLTIDSCLLPLPVAQVERISASDIVRINELRQAMSKVMQTNVDGGSCFFPMEEMSVIHALLKCVLEGTPSLTKPLGQSSLPTKTGVISLREDEDSTDSEFDFDPDNAAEEEVTLNSFQFYPPLQCTLLDAISCHSIPLDSLEMDHLFQRKSSSGEEMLSSVQEEQLIASAEQPENPLGDTKEPQTEGQLQPLLSGQSDQLLESTPLQQVLEPGQVSISYQLPPSNQLPPSHQLPMSQQLLFAEQLYQQQHQQMLEQHGESFQLSPLAEPFVPYNSSFDPVVTSPLISNDPRAQGRLPLQPPVHSQVSPVHAHHSPLHTTIQGSPVHSVPSVRSFGGEAFRGRQQLQPNINQRPAPRVPGFHGIQRMPPPPPPPPSSAPPPAPPSLPVNPYNIQANYPANLLSIIFHLLDKASCMPAGEGELEVQKAKLLCQQLMLVESAAQQAQLQPTLPHPQPFTQPAQSQHGGWLPPSEYPHKGRESLSPPLAAAQMLPPAATCLAPNAPKNGRQKDQDGDAGDGVQPKRADKLSTGTLPSADVRGDSVEEAPVGPQQAAAVDSVAELVSRTVPAAVVEKEGGDSTETVPVRPLRSPTTGLVEERSEDQKSAGDVAGGHSYGDSVQVTMVPVSDVASSQIVVSTCSDDGKNDFQEKLPLDDVESELVESGAAVESGDRLNTKKGHIATEDASSEEPVTLEPASESPPLPDDAPVASSARCQDTRPLPSLSVEAMSSGIEKPSVTSLTDSVDEDMAPPSVSSQGIVTEDSPVCSRQKDTLSQASEAPQASSIQEATIDQGDTQIVASKSSAGSVKADITNSGGSPHRDFLSPITTPAPSLMSQRHLSDPPAGVGSRGQPKIGNSQLTQALLSPPRRYPLLRPPLSLSQLAALPPSFYRPYSPFLSPPRRPSFSGQLPASDSGGFLRCNAPTVPSCAFETAHQMPPSASFPTESNSRAARCLDFTCSVQPVHATASVPTQGVYSPPNGALLAGTAAIANNGLPQRPHPPPPPPPPPGFTIPPLSPHHEVRSSPPTGAPAACAIEASIPPRLPVQPELPVCPVPPQTVPPPLYRFVKVKDLNSSVSEDGFLATPEAFVTQAPPPPPPQPCSLPAPPRAHEQNTRVATSTLPPSSCSHRRPSQGGRRMPAKRTPHHTQQDKPPFRYQGPPLSSQQAHGSSIPNSPFLPPPPGLGWPLPPPPPPPPSSSRYRKGGMKVPPRPPSPHPDLMSNYTARHKISPLISALMPGQADLHFQNYQASGLHVQSLEYNRLMDRRESRVPSYEQFGIPGEQLMQYFCTMLATKGRDLELNLLCGPYYRDLLKCYRVCARENELLSPSFFDKYSCFTVYGEPGHFMVRLNPVTKEGHMTKQSHMTQLGSAPNTSGVPPGSRKGGEEPTVRHGGEKKTLTVANGQQPARHTTKQSENTVTKLELSTISSQGLVNPDVLQVIDDVLNKMFELIGEYPEAEQPLSSVHKKFTVAVTDTETAEVPLPARGDRPMTGSTDREHTYSVVERQLTTGEGEPKLSAGEKREKEGKEISVQPPAPFVSTDSSVQISEAPTPVATTEGSASEENWGVDEKSEEVSTEPLTFSADTMLGATSQDEGSVKGDINVPQPVTSGDKEVEFEKKQSGALAVSSTTVSEATELVTEPSTMEEGDAAVEPVSGGDKVEEGKQLLSSVVPLSAATVARVSELSSAMEGGDAATVEPDTGGDEGEEKPSQISSIPTSVAADQVTLSAESTAEAWGSAADVITEGEEVERKPISVESSTLEDWDSAIEPDAGKEAVERSDICALSLAAEVSLPEESSPIEEDWGAATVEPVTGEDVEQGGEGERPLPPEATHSDESSNKKGEGDIIASTVAVEEKIGGKQSCDLIDSASTGSKEVAQLTDMQFTEEDWDAEAEQLPLSLAAAADEHTLTSQEPAPAWSVVVYDKEGWVEGEQLQSTPEQVALSTQLDPQGLKGQLTSAVVFDEDCWQESAVPEFVSIRSVERKPLRILKREDPYKYDEEVRTRWSEHKPLPPSRNSEGTTKHGGGDRPEKTGKKWKKKKKKKGKRGHERDDRHVRFSPAPRDEAKSTSGEAGEQSSASKDKEQLSSSKDGERLSSSKESSMERERPSSSTDKERPYSSRDSYRGNRWTREREGGGDRSSYSSSQSSREDSSKRGFDGDGGYSGGRRRETREFYGRRNWCMGSTGRWDEYGAGWRRDRKQESSDRSGRK